MVSDVLWDLVQNRKIRRNTDAAARGNRKAHDALKQADEIEAELDRLNIIVHALWEVLKQQSGASERELIEKVREIDLRSGQLDGKPQAAVMDCPGCARAVNSRARACVYCGVALPSMPFPPQP